MIKPTKLLFFATIPTVVFSLFAWTSPPILSDLEITNNTKLWEVMTKLGKINVNNIHTHHHDITKGQELITKGQTTDFHGKPSNTNAKINCVACHTTVKEFPSVGVIDAQKRLEHGEKSNIPFLPGTPFYGLVNRIAFFNNDYQKIFEHSNYQESHPLHAGHKDIRRAIQGCNHVYAKGRHLEPWEVESILAYLWTLELKIGDLQMTEADLAIVKESVLHHKDNAKAVSVLRKYYPEVYPATLPAPLPVAERSQVSASSNDFNNGKRIYKQSCLYCHENGKYSSFRLDENTKTFQMLEKNLDSDSKLSIYNALRYVPNPKNKSNTPHYTKERMTDKQIQDLRFYIVSMAQ